MSTTTRVITVLVMSFAASGAAAQSCPSSPGAAFGVTAYQCANCGVKAGSGGRSFYQFFAEPVVLETTRTSAVHPGDVIEAVNDKPITTSDGADYFTYPPVGSNTVTVRRGRDRQVLRVVLGAPEPGCSVPTGGGTTKFSLDEILSVQIAKGPNAVAQYGPDAANGVLVITTTHGRPRPATQVIDTVRLRSLFPGREPTPIVIIDGVRVDPQAVPGFAVRAPDRTGRYGFAVACEGGCTSARATDGPLNFPYFKYDAYPPIVAIRPGSVAERAGLLVGDLITKVDGRAISDQEAAQNLAKLEWRDAVRLTIRRGDKETEIALRITP